jgi:hypothetical protein
MFSLEAVTVCIDYADFLKEVIPYNIVHFDRWVIVTTKDDAETRELCRKWSLPVILTEEVYRDEDEFNKGRAIIRAIDHLANKGWVLHLDADMALPSHTRWALKEMSHLDKSYIYGVDRVMVKGWDQWQKLKHSNYLNHQFDYHCRINFPAGYGVGARWASREYGYCPVGAFQLWHGDTDLYKGVHGNIYPHRHNDAARADIQHTLYWDRRKRSLIPEVIAAHLESEQNSKLGTNWKGRVSKRFEAPKGK